MRWALILSGRLHSVRQKGHLRSGSCFSLLCRFSSWTRRYTFLQSAQRCCLREASPAFPESWLPPILASSPSSWSSEFPEVRSDKKAALHEYLVYLPAAVAIIGLGTYLQKRGLHHGNEAVGPLEWGYTRRIAVRVADYLFTAFTYTWSDPEFIWAEPFEEALNSSQGPPSKMVGAGAIEGHIPGSRSCGSAHDAGTDPPTCGIHSASA
jgi:hypothetical protein